MADCATLEMLCAGNGAAGSNPALSTIGYGHVVKDDEDFSAGIDETQAEELLRQDAQIAERAVLRLINVPLTDGQFDALVSFTYNLGGGALQRSTLRRKINREEHGEVPDQFDALGLGGWPQAQRFSSATGCRGWIIRCLN